MKRLTGLEGVTLHGETSVMPTHVLAVMFCDPAARGELTARAVRNAAGRAYRGDKGFPRATTHQTLWTGPAGMGRGPGVQCPRPFASYATAEARHHA